MEIRGLTFVGSLTPARDEMSVFIRDVLGLAPMAVDGAEADFYALPDGSSFAAGLPDPGDPAERTIGFLVDDVEAAAAELRAAGVETDEDVTVNGSFRYLHFRAPDGKLYELVEDRPRPDR